MAELKFTKPETTEAFKAECQRWGVALPLRLSDEDTGVVLDRHGLDVFVVDPNSELADEVATARAAWIVCAVNTCGGYIAERVDG